MTPPLKFREWLSAFRAWAVQQPRAVWVGTAVALLILGWVLYGPAIAQVQRLNKERSALTASLKEAEAVLFLFRRGQARVLAGLKRAPEVFSQMEALARTCEIRFLEISPGQPHSSEAGQPVLLPVEIHLEGGYRELGKFLGSLREFEPTIVLVRGIHIGREEQMLPQLRTRLSLELAFSQDAHGF